MYDFYWTQVYLGPWVRSMGPDVTHSLSDWGLIDLADVSQVDEDSNAILDKREQATPVQNSDQQSAFPVQNVKLLA